MTVSPPVVSICMPIFNEEKIVPMLLPRLRDIVGKLGVPCEVIIANDGSRDSTLAQLLAARAAFPELRVVSLSRNFGHPQACTAALEAATGRAIVLMDSDLQDPPELILEFFAKWQAGTDVVYAQRRKRDDAPHRKFFFWAYHRMFVASAGIKVPVDAGNFCMMDRRVLDVVLSLRERAKYLPGLRAWAGFDQQPILFDRPDRPDGEPKVSFSKLVKLAVDGVVSFSTWPLKLATMFGVLALGGSVTLAVVMLILTLTGRAVVDPLTWFGTGGLFVGGLILMALGVIGEYLGRVYDEVKARPFYVVGRRYGFPGEIDDRATRAALVAAAPSAKSNEA